MIDSKELKQNAWFFFERYGEGYLCLNDEYEFYIFFPNQSNEMLSKFSLSEIHPIPLTPQLLSMIEGFKYVDMMFGSPDEVMQYWRKDWFIIDNKGCIRLFNDKETLLNARCRYLHSLQNLYYSLFAEELKLNL